MKIFDIKYSKLKNDLFEDSIKKYYIHETYVKFVL